MICMLNTTIASPFRNKHNGTIRGDRGNKISQPTQVLLPYVISHVGICATPKGIIFKHSWYTVGYRFHLFGLKWEYIPSVWSGV